MNEIEKKANCLKETVKFLLDDNVICGATAKNFDMAIAALEKQILKRPIIKNWNPARCPCCNAELSENMGDGYYKHWASLKICDCGQKLDWSEENE